MMNKKLCLRLMILLATILFFRCIPDQGRERIIFDSTITDIINDLPCRVQVSSMSDSVYAEFSRIDTRNISLVNRWLIDGKTIELYQGKQGGFLALLREDDRVYCAQYVNDASMLSDQSTDIPKNAYSYTFEMMGSGMYIKSVVAFFTDGQCIMKQYWSPTDDEPSRIVNQNDNSILAMVYNQTELNESSGESSMNE